MAVESESSGQSAIPPLSAEGEVEELPGDCDFRMWKRVAFHLIRHPPGGEATAQERLKWRMRKAQAISMAQWALSNPKCQ